MNIEVIDLQKQFGPTRAVDGLSFTVNSGEVIGFVGPNGAGKTTTMRILATLDEPTSGDALIDGVSIVDEPELARKKIGFVPDALPTHHDISVHEYLDFFARAHGIKGAERRNRVEAVEEFTNLLGIREKMLKALSKGMNQRVCLARALLHDPQFLILDEPAAGLDPRARIELRELIKQLKEQGRAILISSHILTELSEICTGALIIERGRLLTHGTLESIVKATRVHQILGIRVLADAERLHRELLQSPFVDNVRPAGAELQFDFEGDEEQSAELLARLVSSGFRIVEFRQQKANLEQLFMHLTKGDVQ